MPPALEAHLAKYRKLVPALALINHLVDHGQDEISQRAMRKALAFSKYLETHARRLYGASNEPERAAAQAILTKIREGELQDGFTAREVHQHDWSGLTDRDQVQAGLNLLVEHALSRGIKRCDLGTRRASYHYLHGKPEGTGITPAILEPSKPSKSQRAIPVLRVLRVVSAPGPLPGARSRTIAALACARGHRTRPVRRNRRQISAVNP
jgi:uncharacterized protein DUF3987